VLQKLRKGDVDAFLAGTTFGMEYDCGEWDRKLPTPEGIVFCTDEVAAHTAKGVGADPTLTFNMFGGEAITRPCASENELHGLMLKALSSNLHQEIVYPGTIHVHVRIPQLLEQVEVIKHLVGWNQIWWPMFAKEIYQSTDNRYSGYDDWLVRCNWDVKTLTYPNEQVIKMQEATTPREVALLLHNDPTDWKNEWHQDTDQIKRPAVNFGHLALNETIEFRCFTTTTNAETLRNIIEFPLNYIRMALTNDVDPLKIVRGKRFMDSPYTIPDTNGVSDMTTGYFRDTKMGIARALIDGLITLEDINYPQYWIDKGY